MSQSNPGTHPTPLRILIVDKHSVVRAGLATVLGAEADLVVVGEAGDGHAAIPLVKHLRPDVVLMEARLPGRDGIESTRQIHADSPATRIVGMSIGADPQLVAAMREAGATGFMDKVDPLEVMLATIRRDGEAA